MQHESHAHGIDMSALGRDKQSLRLAEETVAIEVPVCPCFTATSKRCTT